MDRKGFERLVRRALKELPAEFKDKMENVGVVVEDGPDTAGLKELGRSSKGSLLGLYQGVPQKHRTHCYGMVMPDKITLYRKNIERACAITGGDLYDEVRHVLVHEIAHHFGITDRRLRDLGTY